MIPILDGGYNPDPRLHPKAWQKPPTWPNAPFGTVGISLAADDENLQQDLFFWTDPRMYAVQRKGPTNVGSLIYDMAGGGFLDSTRGARLQSALWVIKEPYGGANALALNIHDSGCGDTRGGLVIELPYDAGSVTAETRIIAELSHHRGGPLVSGCMNDWHRRGVDADGRDINGAHLSLFSNFYKSPTIDGPLHWDGFWEGGETGDKRVIVHFEWDAAARDYKWHSFKDTYTPTGPPGGSTTGGGGGFGGGGVTTGGSVTTGGGDGGIPPIGGGPFIDIPRPGASGSNGGIIFDPFRGEGGIRLTEPTALPGEVNGGGIIIDVDPFGEDTFQEEKTTPPRILGAWTPPDGMLPFTASSKEFASSAFLGRPQMAATNAVDFRNWNAPYAGRAQAMDNVTPVVAVLAAYGEQVGSQWRYNQTPRHGRYLGGTSQGGFVLLPPEVGVDSFAATFQPANIGTLSKPYLTIGPNARLGIGAPDLADGTVDNGWSFSWFLNSEVNLDTGLLLRGNDLCLWKHASDPTPAFAFWHSGAANIIGNFGWRSNTDFWGVIDHANTENRVYTFPDASITLAGGTGAANQVAYWNAANTLTGAASITTDGVDLTLASASLLNWNSDTYLARDAANILALRNSTTAQTFRLYNTFTNASNYERAALLWSSNLFSIVTQGAGSGTSRKIKIDGAGVYIGSAADASASGDLSVGLTGADRIFYDQSTNIFEQFETSTDDPVYRFTLAAANSYAIGIDNSDSDKFKISYGSAGNAALGTNDFLTIGTDGEVTAPQWLQVGTSTDAAAQGDFVAGELAASRLFYDQSVAVLWDYNDISDTTGARINLRKSRAGGQAGATDEVGGIVFRLLNSTPAEIVGASILYTSTNTTAGTEAGVLTFNSRDAAAGANREHLRLNPTDVTVDANSFGYPLVVKSWYEGGTATDAATAGDLSTGLTGAARFFYDQSAAAVELYDSSGNLDTHIDAGSESYLVGNLVVGDNATLFDEPFRVHQNGSGTHMLVLTRDEGANTDENERTIASRVTTTNATVTALLTLALTASRTYVLESRVYARRTGGVAGTAEDGAGYVIRSTWKTVAGVTTIIGAVNADYTAESQAGWDATHASDGAGNVLINVTGAADNNVTWHHVTRVSYVGS